MKSDYRFDKGERVRDKRELNPPKRWVCCCAKSEVENRSQYKLREKRPKPNEECREGGEWVDENDISDISDDEEKKGEEEGEEEEGNDDGKQKEKESK